MAAELVKGSTIAFSDITIAKALANIYRKLFNIKTEIEPELFLETVRMFNLASATGISDAVDAGTDMPDDDFLQAIKTNNEVFSAFRVHKMQNDIAAMMTDSDGKLKSFSKFANDVKPYTDHKNRAWLQTEFNTAVIRAHQAADWKQFEREKDVLPNLEWMPSTSTHPGEDHQPFWGTILPVDDPFWDEHRPGDRWNCKCRLRNTDKEATDVPTGTKNDQPNRGLENNPGKDGKIFSDKHPYMPQSCAACPFGHGKLWALAAGKGKNCGGCINKSKVVGKALVKATKKSIESKVKSNIEKIMMGISLHGTLDFNDSSFISGKLMLLRRSLVDVYEHCNINNNDIITWLMTFNRNSIKKWEYRGWAENRIIKPGEKGYDPKKPDKRKHNETKYFLYYSFDIKGKTYWANVKMHKTCKGEILYTIEEVKPTDLIEGLPKKEEI